MRAGAILIGVCDEDILDSQTLIYAVFYNYRHAIELALKWIIERYGPYATVKTKEDIRAKAKDLGRHGLWKLWQLCKKIIADVGTQDKAIPAVEQLIKDFHDLDRTGQTFRYSTNAGGNPIELPTYPIDLLHTQDVMQGVANFFDGVDAQLDEAIRFL